MCSEEIEESLEESFHSELFIFLCKDGKERNIFEDTSRVKGTKQKQLSENVRGGGYEYFSQNIQTLHFKNKQVQVPNVDLVRKKQNSIQI